MKNEEKAEYTMRINKYLALKKYASRRGADELITKKQVFINDKLAVLGDKVKEGDKVDVRFHDKQKPYIYFAYNKPQGIVTHSAQKNEQDIKQTTSLQGVFPVGRLDKESHGLIILTNDGRIAGSLLGPTSTHEMEYLVRTKNKLRSSFKTKMESGVNIENEGMYKCKIEIIDEFKFKAVVTGEKKHQLRRMCVSIFQEIEDLKQIRVLNIHLGKLGEGEHREIVGEELKTFLHSLELA